MKSKALFFVIYLLVISAGTIKADDLIVAVLEQAQCQEEIGDLMVRILFTKSNGKWIALDNQNVATSYDFSKVTWTIVLDCRDIGQLKTLDPKIVINPEWTYPRDNLLQIKQGTNIPKVLNKSGDFWGWCNAPKFRPLVLVSKPNFKDPERWKPFTPSTKILNSLFPEFKKVVGKVERCQNEEETKLVPYSYKANDLLLFKNYRNTLGQMLISIGLNSKVYNCDGPIDPIWTPNWFLVDKQIHYIGNELTLVDTGDYDNDGKSEVIFWHSGYNEDGYSLFYDNFNSRINFYWKYH